MKTNLNTKKKPDTKSPERKRIEKECFPGQKLLTIIFGMFQCVKSVLIIRELNNKGKFRKKKVALLTRNLETLNLT